MKFSQLCVAGAITLEVLSRGVNFASALKHDVSKETTTTHLMRKDTQVLKNTEMKESFMASHGHRALEENVNINWEPKVQKIWKTSTACDQRGLSMSGDGKTFAIGCKEDNSSTGRVKIYSLVNGQWVPKGEDIVGEKADEELGSSVALSADGSILAIGIMKRSFADKSNAGCIEVYEYIGNGWTLIGGQIKGNNAHQRFGSGVSLSADGHILAGSGRVNNGSRGIVRVFEFVDGQWKPLGSEIHGQNKYDYLGNSLSLSDDGQVMAIGSPYTDVEDNDNTGSFSVYQYDNGWVLMGDTIIGDTTNPNLGYSIQISGNADTVIVGARDGIYVIVYRYNENENQWKQIGQKLSGTNHGDGYGTGRVVSISKDGNTILVPAPYEDSKKGVVRAYKYSGSQWDQLGQDIYGTTENDAFGEPAVLSADGNTLVAAGKIEGASVYTLHVVEEWDGVWYINYDSVELSGNVLTSTYLTKPDVNSDFTVSHTIGTCDSEGLLLDNSVITKINSTATVVDDEISDILDVAKTIDAAAIVHDHDGKLDFCETVTLTNTGESETVNVVQAQSQYNVTANVLAEFGSYSVTLQDDSVITTVDEQSLSPEGTIAVKRCGDLTDSINPGDKLCLEIFVSDSSSVGVDRIHNLDLEQGTSTFAAIDDGDNQYTALVEESCVDGTCTVEIVVPDTLFTNDSGNGEIEFTLSITGDAYLYNKVGEKNSENESKGFNYSVKLEKPCEGGFLRGIVDMLST